MTHVSDNGNIVCQVFNKRMFSRA